MRLWPGVRVSAVAKVSWSPAASLTTVRRDRATGRQRGAAGHEPQFGGSVSWIVSAVAVSVVDVFVTTIRHGNAMPTSACALSGKPDPPVVFARVRLGAS